jgi:hypothetical protein
MRQIVQKSWIFTTNVREEGVRINHTEMLEKLLEDGQSSVGSGTLSESQVRAESL